MPSEQGNTHQSVEWATWWEKTLCSVLICLKSCFPKAHLISRRPFLEKGESQLGKSPGTVPQPQVGKAVHGLRLLPGKGLTTLEQFCSVLISQPRAWVRPLALHRYAADNISCSMSAEKRNFSQSRQTAPEPRQPFPSERGSAPCSASSLMSCCFISLPCFLF